MALAAGGEAQTDRQVSLAGAGGSKEHHVLLGLDVVALSQFQNGLAVQGRDGGELELVQGLEHREASLGDALTLRVGLLPVDFHLQ